jgi:uncharacterized protein YjbI with pentapeptide repeats
LLHSHAQQRKVFVDTLFRPIKFNSPVDYSWTDFISIADFSYGEFVSSSDFSFSDFTSLADFTDAKFSLHADFSFVEFTSDANFNRASFDSKTFFFNTIFASGADFSQVKFNSVVDFSGSEFSSFTDFYDVKFDSLAGFQTTKFKSEVRFIYCILPKYLNLSYVTTIANELDFTNSIGNSKYNRCYVNLVGADIEKIKFRYKRFKLWFPEEDSIAYELKAAVYELLLNKQKKEGFVESFEILSKEYKEFQYTDPDGRYSYSWGHLLNWFDKNWWGYGYSKIRLLSNTIVLLLFFSIINTFIFKHMVNNVYTINKIKNWRNNARGGAISVLFQSIPFAIFYTSLIFFGFRFDIDNLKYEENLKGWKIIYMVYFFCIYILGLLCLGLLANYVFSI